MALQTLCMTYWDPLYAFVRRSGAAPEDAQDLVQGYIATLLERRDFEKVAPRFGRLRSFLLAGVKHFMLNEWKKSARIKRGGGALHLPLDLESVENGLASRTCQNLAPDAIFDRRWALKVLDTVLLRIRSGSGVAGKPGLVQDLIPSMLGESGARPYAEVATRHGMSEAAVKMASQRLRARFRECLKEEVCQTVCNQQEVENELRELIKILRS